MAFGKPKNKVESISEALFYVVPVLLIFGLIFLCSLTFRYVEGDDAASVAFHAFGRDFNLQPPYSAYQGMMDVFLYLLPADESTLRRAAVVITAVSAVVFVLLVINLIKEWLPNLRGFKTALTATIILLCTPEIFYLSLFYSPGLTAMCFVLASHKLLRRFSNAQKDSKNSALYNGFIFLSAVLLFGVGVACRWDIGGLYLIVICADLILNNYADRQNIDSDRQQGFLHARFINDDEILNFQRIRLTVLFAASAFAASIFAIFLSGYNLIEIYNTLNLYNTALVISEELSIVSKIGIFQSIFTPALLIFSTVGFFYLLIKRKRSAVFVLITVIPILIYAKDAHSKMILPALPSIFLAAAAGINFICFEISKKYLVLARVLTIVAISLPWLVGIQINSPNTSWGPGFDIRAAGESENDDRAKQVSEDRTQKQKLSLQDFRIVLGGGFAIPTAEGARPLGGHFYALIGGQWRTLLEKFDDERVTVLREASLRDINILQDSGNPYLVTKLLETGYRTADPYKIFSAQGINDRTFTKGNEKIHLQALKIRASLFSKKTINDLIGYNKKEILLYSSYSSVIKKLKDTAPNAVQILGPFSAAINLEEYAESDKLQD